MAKKTPLEKIKALADSICKYAKGGATIREYEGWSHKFGRKTMKWISERKQIEALANEEGVEVRPFGRGIGFGVAMLDASTDAEYFVAFDPPVYMGGDTFLYADIICNASKAYEETA